VCMDAPPCKAHTEAIWCISQGGVGSRQNNAGNPVNDPAEGEPAVENPLAEGEGGGSTAENGAPCVTRPTGCTGVYVLGGSYVDARTAWAASPPLVESGTCNTALAFGRYSMCALLCSLGCRWRSSEAEGAEPKKEGCACVVM
jgi:hypothetical protein